MSRGHPGPPSGFWANRASSLHPWPERTLCVQPWGPALPLPRQPLPRGVRRAETEMGHLPGLTGRPQGHRRMREGGVGEEGPSLSPTLHSEAQVPTGAARPPEVPHQPQAASGGGGGDLTSGPAGRGGPVANLVLCRGAALTCQHGVAGVSPGKWCGGNESTHPRISRGLGVLQGAPGHWAQPQKLATSREGLRELPGA